jgi:hypothetical protein
MGKFSQIIEGKVYPKSLVRFKHSTNKAGETVTEKTPVSKIALAFKSNGLLLFKPLRNVRDKEMGNISYTCLIEKTNCVFSLGKAPFFTKIDKNGKPTDKWTKFSDLKTYRKAFELYKKNVQTPKQDDFAVTFLLEKEKDNKEEDTKSQSKAEKKIPLE